jgi:BASS family bile acid:Na+ symporter
MASMADPSSLMPAAGAAQILVGAVQALTMLTVGLHLDLPALRGAAGAGRPLLAGLAAQWLLLPLATLLLIALARPPADTALGLMLVAATPGGGAAVYLSLIGRADLALSVALTTVSTLLAAALTPALFAAQLFLAGAAGGAVPLHLDFLALAGNMAGLLLLPLAAGLAFNHRLPRLAWRLRGPLKLILGLVLGALVVLSLQRNAQQLVDQLPLLAPLVAIHNGLAMLGGWLLARWSGLPPVQARTATLGAGVNNSGIALALALSLFAAAPAALAVVLWWSGWRLFSGWVLALHWSRRARRALAASSLTVTQ